MGRDDGGASQACVPIGDAGERVQRIGVDDGVHRQGRGGQQRLAHEGLRACAPSQTAADQQGVVAVEGGAEPSARVGGVAARRIDGRGEMGGLGELGGEDGPDGRGSDQCDITRAGACCAHAGKVGRAHVGVGTCDGEDAPEATLVRPAGARRELLPDPRRRHDVRGRTFESLAGDADVGCDQLADVVGGGEAEVARLGRAEGDRSVGGHGRGVCVAGVGVDAGGDVDGEDVEVGAPGLLRTDGFEDRAQRLGQGAAAARAQHGVDDEVGGAKGLPQACPVVVVRGIDRVGAGGDGAGEERVGGARRAEVQLDVRAPVAEVAPRDEAVAAVGAGADEDQGVVADAHASPGVGGHGEAGALHEGVRGDAVGLSRLLQAAHLLGGEDSHHRRRPPPPLRSPGSGRGIST